MCSTRVQYKGVVQVQYKGVVQVYSTSNLTGPRAHNTIYFNRLLPDYFPQRSF